MAEVIEFGKEDVGRLIDESQGWRVIGGAIRLAVTAGYAITPSDAIAVEAFENEFAKYTDAFGIVRETAQTLFDENGLADRAITWLNKEKAPEGCAFHFYEGAFYLSELEKQNQGEESNAQ